MWVPGHCNIQGNEEADCHAKNAVTKIKISNCNQITFFDKRKNNIKTHRLYLANPLVEENKI